jgi:hypothetical protein
MNQPRGASLDQVWQWKETVRRDSAGSPKSSAMTLSVISTLVIDCKERPLELGRQTNVYGRTATIPMGMTKMMARNTEIDSKLIVRRY